MAAWFSCAAVTLALDSSQFCSVPQGGFHTELVSDMQLQTVTWTAVTLFADVPLNILEDVHNDGFCDSIKF
jgi:hypothetical protein